MYILAYSCTLFFIHFCKFFKLYILLDSCTFLYFPECILLILFNIVHSLDMKLELLAACYRKVDLLSIEECL